MWWFIITAIIVIAVSAIIGYTKPALGMIILPLTMSIPLFSVAALLHTVDFVIPVLIFSALIFVATLVGVLKSERYPDSYRTSQVIAKWLLISFAMVCIFIATVVLFGAGSSIGFLFFIIFMTSIISYGFTSRQVTAAYVISTIGASMRQNLPLAMALESASSGRTDKGARILRRIKKWLVQGYSLAEAVKRGWPRCPSRAIAMLTAAEKTGQLPLAVKAIETDMVTKADESKKVKPFHPLYPIIVIICAFLIVLALMSFVIPKFVEVLEDVVEGQVMPASTRFLLSISTGIHKMGPFLLIAVVLIIFVGIPAVIRIRLRQRRPDKPYLISRISDFIKWRLPILHWFERNYSMLQTVEILRLSLNAGCSVNNAISNTLGMDINSCFRKRLGKWLAAVEAGDNISDSSRRSGLGSTLAWAFDEKINRGNTPVILETLESFYRANYSYRINLVRYAMGPCITIVLGGIVGFVVYAVFIAMVTIINVYSNLLIS